MIASYHHKFIFIKTRKTGGTSVEIALSTQCSGDDICTTISGEDELLRFALNGEPRNFCDDPHVRGSFFEKVASGDADGVNRIRKNPKIDAQFYNHMPASEVRQELPELFKSAYKFTIERHPYDRAISLAWWRSKGAPVELSEAIDQIAFDRKFPNYPQYVIGGDIVVDKIIAYESLSEGLQSLERTLGIVLPSLPNAKSQYRNDRRPAKDSLSKQQREKIYEVTATEFEIMRYER